MPRVAPQAGLAGLSESQYDAVRGGAVVFLGTLARHLDPENPKASTKAPHQYNVPGQGWYWLRCVAKPSEPWSALRATFPDSCS